MIYKCLSIAGFDSSGGAGIQADLKTFTALGCYGMTVLTAIPIQNTCGVRNCYSVGINCIKEQLDAIFEDIIPDTIKIGMLFSKKIIELVAKFLDSNAKNIPIILDPVMLAKSGDLLLKKNAIAVLRDCLLPLASIITPNLPEAIVLLNIKHTKHLEKKELASQLLQLGPKSVLLKGGHETGLTATDLFLSKESLEILSTKRINTKNTHGTGCTLSAAIASFMAKGKTTLEACRLAKKYLFDAIDSAKDHSIGLGFGPVNHLYKIEEKIKY